MPAGRYKLYHPVRKVGRQIPWGYDVSRHDPDLLVPNLEQLKLLDQAERAWLAGTTSHSEIARWLSAKTGRPISRKGLEKRLFRTSVSMRKRAIRSTAQAEEEDARTAQG